MQFLFISAAILFTYVLASDILFLGLRCVLRKEQSVSPKELFFLTRGVGPIVISWLTYNLFLLSPHQPPWYYVGVVGGFFAGVFVFSRHELPSLLTAYAAFGHTIRRLHSLHSLPRFLLTCVLLVCLFILLVGIGFPIVGHDSLIHAIDARLIHQNMSLEHYLTFTQPDPRSGYLPVAFQVPFLQMLYAWFALFAGIGQMDVLARTVSPIFGLHCLLLLGYLVSRRASLLATIWAVFLLAVTPLFLLMSYDNAQDTPRYYFALLALMWFAKLIEAGATASLPLKVIVGLFAGFAAYSHLLSAPVVSAGLLGVVLSRQQRLPKKLVTVLLIAVVATVASVSYHYLISAPIRAKLVRNFSWYFVTEWTAVVKSAQQWTVVSEESSQEEAALHAKPAPRSAPSRPAPPPSVSSTQRPTILDGRGQGSTPLKQFLFGRLQMFTGVEHFGFLFFVFWVAVFFWIRRASEHTTFDLLLFASALAYCIVVLSGARKFSWSNPRYIGSLIVIGAYFSGPALARLTEALAVRSRQFSRVVAFLLILTLSFPVLLVTTVRGAKVGITNTGTFYTDMRSLRWLDYLRTDPINAISDFWQNYVGIRQTIRYALASDADKLRHAHDYFAAIQYLNTHTSADARALVLREGRYFYYAQRSGVWISDRRLWGQRLKSAAVVVRLFTSLGITHIITDSFLETNYPLFSSRHRLKEVLSTPSLSELVYEFKSARVYRLRLPDRNEAEEIIAALDEKPVTRQTETETQAPMQNTEEVRRYIVSRGDTLSKIAQAHGIPLAQLLAANLQYRRNPHSLRIGDGINIPVSKKQPDQKPSQQESVFKNLNDPNPQPLPH